MDEGATSPPGSPTPGSTGEGRPLAWLLAALAVPASVIAFHARAAAPGQAFVGQDLRYFFFGIREATAAALRAGHLPGWQRGMFLGYPLLGDPQAAVFAPGTWLTLPWSAPRALTLGTLLHLCLAGWGVLLWLRRRDLGPVEALLGALLFALGAKQTAHLQHWTFAASTAWWGFMMAGLEGFARDARGRDLALTAGAAALSWLGGAAQLAYLGTLVAGAYALWLSPGLWRRRPADALLALAAAPLGFLLAAPVLLPVLELARLGPRGAGVAYAFATSWKWPDRWGLALLVLPRSYGGAWRFREMNLHEATGYLGLLPLALAAAAPLRRRGARLFLALAAVGVWLCWGEDAWLGLHRAFCQLLPGYGSFRNPTRSLLVTSLLGAALAAEGLAAVRAGRGRTRAALVLGALAVTALWLPRAAGFPLDREAAGAGAGRAVALALASLLWLLIGRLLAWRSRDAGEVVPPGASRRGGRDRPSGRALWSLGACALTLADLYLAFGDFNPVGPASAETPALADAAPWLPAAPDPRRLAVLARWGRTANAPLREGWEGVTGYGPSVIQRVRALLLATVDDRLPPLAPVTGDIDLPRPRPTSALWPLFGAPLLASDGSWPLPVVGPLGPEWNLPTLLYRTPALPRVFWTGAWSFASDAEATAPLLAAARGDRALLSDDAPRGQLTRSGAPAGPLAAEAVTVEGGRLEATVEAPREGVAVILEPWFPGWAATVDGVDTAVVRADYAFMAVPLTAGRHRLRLDYRPAQLGRGVATAAAAAGLALGVLAWRRRSSGPR